MFTLSQALEAIKNKPEFSVKERGSYTVIDYVLNNKETFVGSNEEETLILLNLRGTAFDNESGRIIRLGFEKFFNFGEFPESDKQLNFDDDHLITQKLDGSCIFPIYANEGTFFGTRAGVTDISKMAEDFALSTDIYYCDFIHACMTIYNATPIFEFCSRKNRVVLDYPEDMLVLTGIRYIDTGVYFDYRAMSVFASSYDIPVVKRIDSILQNSFNSFKESVSGLVDDEGVVIRFESGICAGAMVKMKATAYCLQHKALDQLKFAKDVLLLSLNGLLDDVLPLLAVDNFNRVSMFVDEFASAVSAKDIDIQNEYFKYEDIESQKDFALAIANHPYKQFMFGIRAGKNCFDMLVNYCKVNCGTQAKCDDLQKFLGMTVKY